MATKPSEAKPADEPQAEAEKLEDAAPQAQTLTEYCAVRSKTDRRVELIGAFFSDERRQGNVKDLASAYDARFEAFTKKPTA